MGHLTLNITTIIIVTRKFEKYIALDIIYTAYYLYMLLMLDTKSNRFQYTIKRL